MKRTLRHWFATLIAAGLASSAWADLAQWVGCEVYVGSPCQPGNWAYSGNWIRQGLPQQPTTGGPPLAWDVVRLTPNVYTTTPINYVDTKSFGGGTPIFDSLSIQGVAVTHSGTFDSMRTLSLTIGAGGKYTFDSASGGVSLGGAFVPWNPIDGPYVPVTSAVIGSLNGSASFEHLGSGGVSVGAIDAPNNLVLGRDAGSSGQYLMGPGAGTLYLGFTHSPSGAVSSTVVGQGGDGSFVQQGGSHVTGALVLGQNAADAVNGIPAATGIYVLGDGTLEVLGPGNSLQVGLGGSGTFNQSGGSVTAQGVTLGVAPGSLGNYLMTAGTATTGDFVVGAAGSGSFQNSNGTHTVNGNLTLGGDTGSTGTYVLATPGQGGLWVNGNATVGRAGTGQLDLVGGDAFVSGNVVVAAQAGSTGTLNVSGGGLYAANVNVNAGGTLNYSGGSITLDSGAGKLTNAAGGQVNVFGGGSLTIDGNVDNAGTLKVTGPGTAITFTGNFVNSGAYIQDPSTSIFQKDLSVSGNGFLVGGLGDIFEIGGGFLNASTNASQWETNLAMLIFDGAGEHLFGVAGGIGSMSFGWGDIRAGPGVHLSFYDSVFANNGMALYVGVLDLVDGLNAILLDPGELLTIYFDQSKKENAYLLAALGNPGGLPAGLTLVAYGDSPPTVPESPTLALLALGLVGMAAVRRRAANDRRQPVADNRLDP